MDSVHRGTLLVRGETGILFERLPNFFEGAFYVVDPLGGVFCVGVCGGAISIIVGRRGPTPVPGPGFGS